MYLIVIQQDRLQSSSACLAYSHLTSTIVDMIMKTLQKVTFGIVFTGLFGLLTPALFAAESQPDQAGLDFFEKKIRPVLIQHCYECHSEDTKNLKGSLLLDSKHGLLKGGDSGAALVPGKPAESLLLETLRYGEDSYQMPPKGKLPDAVIANFEKWIAMGAPDPRNKTSKKQVKAEIDFAKAREFWSFQAPKSQPAPAVKQQKWPLNKIDYFILAAQESKGFSPAPAADKQTLIRRAYFDLIGLPPTPEEVQQFVNDSSPQAYEKLIDRLLSSPHYGERWGRHWLDVARYAEDNTNMGPHNGPYPHAYRYRDWVIKAFNDDVPYDKFIIRQLATDFLPETGPEDYPALGYMGLGPSYHKEVALSRLTLENRYADDWEDRVDSLCRGLLGLTMACARCHDHKYDPLTVEDYYGIAGVFASVRQTTRPIIPDAEIAKTQPARDKADKFTKQNLALTEKIRTWNKRNALLKEIIKKSPKPEATLIAPRPDIKKQEIIKFLPPAEELKQNTAQIAKSNKTIKENKAKIADIKKATPGFDLPLADALTEEQIRVEEITADRMKIVYYPNKPRDLNVFIRGSANNLGKLVPRRFVQVLSKEKPKPFKNGSGRLELAHSIANRDNPLTARVMVNRVWLHHFGEGLVDTPSNFGKTGALPSHPELLDDLAVWFMDQGWSIKKLHRRIMLSATYRQTSNVALSEAQKITDPNNRLLSYFNRRRLEAEVYRDALLVAGANLDLKQSGPSGDIDDSKFDRRGVYAMVSRHKLSTFLQSYDFPDPAIHAARRANTTTPLQQLFVLNSPFVRQQAQKLAKRLEGESSEKRIDAIYQMLFSRAPTRSEMQIGLQFLEQIDSTGTPTPTVEQIPTFAGKRIKANVKELGDHYSVELWVKNQIPNDQRIITGYFFSRGKDSAPKAAGDHLGIAGKYRPNKEGRLFFYNGDQKRQSLFGNTVIQPGTWNHVVMVRDQQNIRVYLNGNSKPEISGKAKPGYESGVSEIIIAGRNDNFSNFHGQLGAVAVFNRVLNPNEIQKHFQAAKLEKDELAHAEYLASILESDPLSCWPLRTDNPHFSQAVDITKNKNNGTYEGRQDADPKKLTPWQRYCQALLCSNEMMFVD
ncbi:Planctomycete cytochrome C [Gimesia aquarii]|uniref:Planctomycete cytochrome C n=2 Tax=Gimesia aquarii TaxID=2527964 RepID=A0A517X105_9PLAN|nr:Planctomycete cytochrome C [Gimesia aquarii]